jgi:hypothetical protein
LVITSIFFLQLPLFSFHDFVIIADSYWSRYCLWSRNGFAHSGNCTVPFNSVNWLNFYSAYVYVSHFL